MFGLPESEHGWPVALKYPLKKSET